MRKAVVIASPKIGALYYDRISPLPGKIEYIEETEELLNHYQDTAKDLISEDITFSDLQEILQITRNNIHRESDEELKAKYLAKDKNMPNFSSALEMALYEAAVTCGLCKKKDLVLPELVPIATLTSEPIEFTAKDNVLVKLAGINLVNPTNATWDQIFEFRKDKKAKAAFRNLRDYLFTKCAKLTDSELEDHLLKLKAEYESKSKEHGFETKVAALEVLLKSKTIITLGSGIFGWIAQSLFSLDPSTHLPIFTSSLSGMAISFDIGKAVIASKRKLLEKESFDLEHPGQWVFLADKTFNG